jgi:hypothetical protein
MPRDTNSILVEPMAGSCGLLFRVESWTNPSEPHLVDLTTQECSCKHWQCRVGPALKAGADPFTKEGSCKHVRAVHRYWLRHCLAAVVEAHKTNNRTS